MTTQTEALKLALELFEQFCRDSRLKYEHQAIYKTITAIKEALAQQNPQGVSNAQVEPVGRIASNVKPVMRQEVMLYTDKPLPIGTALYVKEKL